MRESLNKRCETQLANEGVLRKAGRLEYESIIKLGALLYVEAGREVDLEHLKECKRILKDKVGMFSNLRGIMEFVVRIKVSLADDPEAYIDGVLGVYQRLKAGLMLPGEQVALAATTIFDNCPPERLDEVTDKTLAAYKEIKKQHRFLTGEEDMALVALMVMAGMDPMEAAASAEELYQQLKGKFLPGSETPQSAAMVLALSDKPNDEKVRDFLGLYDACKAAKCATSRDLAMVVYAAFVDLDYDRSSLVSEIAEVDAWLKGKKGYGTLGVGGSIRRLFAAAMVLEDRQASQGGASTKMTSAVTQAVVEELLMILVTIIVISAVMSTANSSRN